MLTSYKEKIAKEINAQLGNARRRRLATVSADDIEISNIKADASGGITFDVKIKVRTADKPETLLNKVENFVEKLETKEYADKFKAELKTDLKDAGAVVDDTKFIEFSIAEATKKPALAIVSEDGDSSGVAIGVGAGVGVPLFLALLYFIRRHYQNRSGGDIVRSGGKAEGTIKAGDEASLSAAV